jgi:ribosomal protein S6
MGRLLWTILSAYHVLESRLATAASNVAVLTDDRDRLLHLLEAKEKEAEAMAEQCTALKDQNATLERRHISETKALCEEVKQHKESHEYLSMVVRSTSEKYEAKLQQLYKREDAARAAIAERGQKDQYQLAVLQARDSAWRTLCAALQRQCDASMSISCLPPGKVEEAKALLSLRSDAMIQVDEILKYLESLDPSKPTREVAQDAAPRVDAVGVALEEIVREVTVRRDELLDRNGQLEHEVQSLRDELRRVSTECELQRTTAKQLEDRVRDERENQTSTISSLRRRLADSEARARDIELEHSRLEQEHYELKEVWSISNSAAGSHTLERSAKSVPPFRLCSPPQGSSAMSTSVGGISQTGASPQLLPYETNLSFVAQGFSSPPPRRFAS